MQTWLEESRKACNRSWYQLPELLPKEQGSAPLQGWLTGQFLGSSAWRLLWVFCNLSRNVRVLLQHPHSCPQAVLRQNLASSNESTLFSSYKRQKQEPIASSLVGDRMRFHSSVLRPQAKARKARLPSLWGNRRGWPLAGGGGPSSCRCHRAAHREDNSRPEASRWAVREPEQLSGRGKNIPQWHHGQRPKTQTPPYKMQLSPGISFQGLQCRAGDVSLWASLCTQECSVSFTSRTAWQQRQLWLIQVPHQRQPEHLSRTRILIHNRCSVSTVDLRNDFSLVKWAVFKMRGLTQNPAPVGAE